MNLFGFEIRRVGWDTTPAWARAIIHQNELILAALRAKAQDDPDIERIYDTAQGIVAKDDEALKK